MFGLSKEQTKVLFTQRCPVCRAVLRSFGPRKPAYFKADGAQLSELLSTLFSFLPLPKIVLLFFAGVSAAECPECLQRWPLFTRSKVPASKPLNFVNLRVDTIMETTRSEESLGEEKRIIDNSQSAIALDRRFTVTKEWSQSCILGHETTRDLGGGLTVGLHDVASLTATAKAIITKRYSISEETKQTYTEEITLKIPAKTKLTVTFKWKRIWQHGLIKLYDEKGRLHELQFKIGVGVTFDQTQLDDI